MYGNTRFQLSNGFVTHDRPPLRKFSIFVVKWYN